MPPEIHSASGNGASTQEFSLSRLVHDLNNHLGVVMGNAELLLDQTLDACSVKRIEAMRTAAAKACQLLGEVQKNAVAPDAPLLKRPRGTLKT
jgi:hypothetical protein